MKKVISTLLAASFCASIFAFEWGGQLGNNTTFDGNKIDDLDLTQTNDITLWFTTPLNKENTLRLSAEGVYRFKYDNEEDDITNILNLNLLKLSYNKKIEQGAFSLSAGRFFISDVTGLIFSQQNDGLHLNFSNRNLSVSAYGGYTGLLNTNVVSILYPYDSEYEDDENDFYSLAPKYIPFGISVSLPNIFANQRFTAEGWGFADLNGDDYNRFYAMASFDGYLASNFNYKVATSFGTENFENLMNLTTLGVSFMASDIFFINGGASYASESNVGFTSQTATLALSEPEYSDLIKFDLSATMNINNQGIANAGVGLVFDESFGYTGFQWQANFLWNIFSDLNVGFSAYQFYGDNSDDDKTSLSITAALNF